MKKLIVLLAVFAVTASVAYADRIFDQSMYTITATPIGSQPGGERSPIGWSNIDQSGTNYTTTTTGAVDGYDDYTTSPAIWGYGSTFTLEKFRFIGGVSAAGQVIWFDFYHSNTVPDGVNYYDYFGVQLPQAGNWIWTITMTTPKTIDTHGYVESDATDYGYGPATLTWYADTSGPTVGTTVAGPLYGGTPPVSLTRAFEFEGTPEPGSLLLLGIAGLFLRRR